MELEKSDSQSAPVDALDVELDSSEEILVDPGGCGNYRNSGQVLLGNAVRPAQLRRAFDPAARLCHALPASSLQRSDRLGATPSPEVTRLRDCAQAGAEGEQGRTINQIMAALLATYVEWLLDGTWTATYGDLDNGLLQWVPPNQVV